MKRSLILGAAQGAGILGVIVLGVLIAYAADIFSVDQDGTVRLRIASNGNVGVGTSADAGSRLEVRGSGTTSATSALNVTSSAGTSRLFVRDDGKVGVGSNNPGATMDVAGDMLLNGGALKVAGQYALAAGTTIYIPDSDIPRDGLVIISVSADNSPGSIILQVYRQGTYNGAWKMASASTSWSVGTTSEPAGTNWRVWIENNTAGARLVVKNIETYGRNFRIYTLGY